MKLLNQLQFYALAMIMCLGTSGAASAGGRFLKEVSGNITLTNDYVFRGYTQANEDPAIQGGLDWDSGAGFYAGVWGSSVNFRDSDEASTEFDFYTGFKGEVESFSYDIGFIYYLYPGANTSLNYNFWEVYSNAGYDFGPAAISVGLAYTSDNFADTGNGVYLQSGVSLPIGEVFSINANLNYYDVEISFGEDYLDWSIGGKLSTQWFDADLNYIDTDISTGCSGICDGRIIFSISRSF